MNLLCRTAVNAVTIVGERPPSQDIDLWGVAFVCVGGGGMCVYGQGGMKNERIEHAGVLDD